MAKTTIGKLNAILTLSSDAFTKGLRSARRAIGTFGKRMASGIASIAKYGAALAGVAAGAFALFLRQQMQVIDATAKTAKSLGITTEALTALTHAADLSGATQEELTKGIQRMQKNISDASVGLTTAQRAFEALGLSHQALAAMTPEEQFKTIAEAMSGLSSQAEKTRVAMDIFGRAGLKLVPLMNEGAAGIEAMMEEARRLGITFDEEAAAKVEMANDAMTRLKGLLTGALRQAVIQIAPFIQAVTERLTEMGLAGEGVGARVSQGFEFAIKVVAKLADWFQLLKAAFHGLQAVVLGGLTGVFTAIDGLIAGLEKVLKIVGVELPAGIRDFTRLMAEGLEQDTLDAAKKAQAAFDNFIEGTASKQAQAWIDGIREGADKAAKELAAKTAAARIELDPEAGADGKGSFAQIVRSRTAFGAPGERKAQTFRVMGMAEAIGVLYEIKQLMKRGTIARAV